CHWCHVMEHESFEDSAVAALMNEAFVCIKVDREERPDIDKIYMNVCQLLTGSGGWPLTVLLTPQRKPFFAGTYFPKTGRYGRIGLLELVPRVSQLWRSRPADLQNDADKVVRALAQAELISPGDALGESVLAAADQSLAGRYDSAYGGFGEAPKFPTPHQLNFLLRWWKRSGEAHALAMVTRTLEAMRLGGIWDHVGYGFHRYATDRQWLVPHFEKMLYDQALICLAYLEAYQATGRDEFARTAREIFTYVLRDLAAPEGGFYSAEDADSEGEEGKFYLWRESELVQVLDEADARLAGRVFNTAAEGNFTDEASGNRPGANILHLTRSPGELAGELGLGPEELECKVEQIRRKLFEARAARVRPALDNKVLTDWNALMLAALAQGGLLLGDETYLKAARACADFILTRMADGRGRLLHRWAGGEAGIEGNLDDYAFTVWGLLDLYEADFDPAWLEAAVRLQQAAIDHFWDGNGAGAFYFTADDGEELIGRQKDLYDGALPSGNSVAAANLLRLARITGNAGWEAKADSVGRAFAGTIAQAPSAFARYLCALDFALGPTFEVVVAAGDDSKSALEMARTLQKPFVPGKVMLLKDAANGRRLAELARFTRELVSIEGRATAYVCRDYACALPTTDIARAAGLLTANAR
ncbi:MAG TPA: thioredoxin domain-containing protein, partial [Candidatus Glassbacteria bacterium]|nr:thioredoxin domain-containing protein [Candidatus Glassbacteria bacterium]